MISLLKLPHNVHVYYYTYDIPTNHLLVPTISTLFNYQQRFAERSLACRRPIPIGRWIWTNNYIRTVGTIIIMSEYMPYRKEGLLGISLDHSDTSLKYVPKSVNLLISSSDIRIVSSVVNLKEVKGHNNRSLMYNSMTRYKKTETFRFNFPPRAPTPIKFNYSDWLYSILLRLLIFPSLFPSLFSSLFSFSRLS